MTLKKQAISITLIILLLTINSGCISLEDTSFTMLSKAIIDYEGFPSLMLRFDTNDVISVNLIDSDRQIAFTDSFYSSENETVIPLAPYRNIPQPGVYQVQVYDKNDNPIYNETLRFNEINFSIISVQGHWWKENPKYSLIGITITVANSGDLPAYPYSLDFNIDNKSTSADILPAVVLPGENRSINCSLYIDNMERGERNCSLSVYDKNGELLADSSFQTIPQENVPIQNFEWDYNGKNEISIPYPGFLSDYYTNLERLDTKDYAAYVFDPYDDLYLTLVKDSLVSIDGEADGVSKINLVASFVQNLEYGEDDPLNSSYEYPLYPIEALNSQPCDCEDRSILAGNIFMLMDYNVSLLSLPKHMAIGVHVDQNLSEYSFYVDEYYYLETIKENMVLGDVPTLYRSISEEAVVYPLTSRPILHHEWKNADGILVGGKLDFVKLKLIIENIGDASAENILITAAFYSSNNHEYNQEKVSISSLSPGEKKQNALNLIVPNGVSVILKTKLYFDDILIEEKQSATKFP
ncbi:MAG: hypothetical protein JSW60_07580 [Thermoplasmatales archaeon]|nr:MAG: hypothetical protein JSW60_07580 [Thermoplasmatales archaeon]